MNDLKFAFRQRLKNPGFTAVDVNSLAMHWFLSCGAFLISAEIDAPRGPGRWVVMRRGLLIPVLFVLSSLGDTARLCFLAAQSTLATIQH
jgi:hypothetical protein